jgi:predicted ester cyclase
MNRSLRPAGIAAAQALALLAACAPAPAPSGGEQVAAPPTDLCPARLATFDTLDYVVFSGQAWDRLPESHAADIVVTWPDGHETTGLAKHTEDLAAMFAYVPDMKVAEHPVKVCSGDYTAVMGIMTGTFSRPMATPDGKSIPPTGKSFRLAMTTIGHWTGNTMDHEWLFWDNHAFLQQIGLAP